MKNPLWKRVPRNFRGEFGKYLAVFLFMAMTIGFCSGFLVAGGSMIEAYDESFEKYNIEDGHFVTEEELSDEQQSKIEKEGEISIYPLYYSDRETDCDLDGKKESTVRVFAMRETVNKVCLMEGEYPETDTEIAIDRMYADNNDLSVGSQISVGGKELTVSGLVALSDYSALFSDNEDLMFDSLKFSVAVMTQDGVSAMGNAQKIYCYAWKYEEKPEDEIDEKEVSDDLMETIAAQVLLQDYVPQYSNQAIHFTGDDMGGDKAMIIVLLYILIAILAFVFAITIQHTIVREASVIGTLRASGYTKAEMLGHYLATPLLVTITAAIVGNILGYTCFKDVVAALYYNSYSLPTYQTIWNADAFVLTTVVPLLIMLVLNVLMLWSKLSLSPLRFLRGDLSRKKNARAVRLPKFSFMNRFRLRIIIQNRLGYLILFVGIAFANLLLLFGMMMSPLLEHYQEKVTENMIAKYQYILKTPVEIDDTDAEKYCVTSLTYQPDKEKDGEEISIYGVEEDSSYAVDMAKEDGISVSDGFADKYELQPGDTVTLRESYGETEYRFKITRIVDYPGSLCIFMTRNDFTEKFGQGLGAFNGYFSDKKLADLPEEAVAACITKDDLTKVSRQLTKSMGGMFQLMNVFSALLAALLIYLLTKLIIERNVTSISMVKILGYRNGEIVRLYIVATTVVVAVSEAVSLALATWTMNKLYRVVMADYSGWLQMYIEPLTYGKMVLIVLVVYVIVALLQFGKIKKIPMDEALKNVE